MSTDARRFSRTLKVLVLVLRPLLLIFTARRWSGAEHLPEGGYVLAANHVSHSDPLIVSHLLIEHGVPPRFLAKASLFRVPGLGAILRAADQIPVVRDSEQAERAYTAAVRAVSLGRCVIVYPEGTITREPDLWPMTGRTGAARIGLATGCPVVPVAMWGPQKLLPPYTKVPRLLSRTKMYVAVGAPVDLDDLRGKPLDVGVLREASTRVMDAITDLLAQIRGEEPPATRFDPREQLVHTTGNPARRRIRAPWHRRRSE